MLLALVLAAAPAPSASVPDAGAWPEIPTPLGHVATIVEPPAQGGARGEDRPVLLNTEGCGPQVVSLMRFLGGTAHAVEQLQAWLDSIPDLEKKLFAKKGQLGEVVKFLADAKLEPKKACSALPVTDGYAVQLDVAPKKLCPAEATRTVGDWWFFNKGKPAAVVNLELGAKDVCKPMISGVLFDPQGRARVRYHADWSGSVSASLVGDKCQVIDFGFKPESLTFAGTLKSCKR